MQQGTPSVTRSITTTGRTAQPSARALLASLCLALLSACTTTNVQVDTSFPTPVIGSMHLHLGVHYDEAFSTYLLSDEIPQGGQWNVDIGAAQVLMFRQMLPAMFDTVTELESPDAPVEGVQAILVPRVEDMQFSIPLLTRTSVYEVWIKYDLSMYTPDGELIARWPLVAYGKEEDDGVMESGQGALQSAAISALRDAAAFLTIRFRDQDALDEWLATNFPDEAAAVDTDRRPDAPAS